jgi:hypothetical protein
MTGPGEMTDYDYDGQCYASHIAKLLVLVMPN